MKKNTKRLEMRQEFERQSEAYTKRFGHPPVGLDAFYVMLAAIKEAGFVVQRARTKRPVEPREYEWLYRDYDGNSGGTERPVEPQEREYEYGRWPPWPPKVSDKPE